MTSPGLSTASRGGTAGLRRTNSRRHSPVGIRAGWAVGGLEGRSAPDRVVQVEHARSPWTTWSGSSRSTRGVHAAKRPALQVSAHQSGSSITPQSSLH